MSIQDDPVAPLRRNPDARRRRPDVHQMHGPKCDPSLRGPIPFEQDLLVVLAILDEDHTPGLRCGNPPSDVPERLRARAGIVVIAVDCDIQTVGTDRRRLGHPETEDDRGDRK